MNLHGVNDLFIEAVVGDELRAAVGAVHFKRALPAGLLFKAEPEIELLAPPFRSIWRMGSPKPLTIKLYIDLFHRNAACQDEPQYSNMYLGNEKVMKVGGSDSDGSVAPARAPKTIPLEP